MKILKITFLILAIAIPLVFILLSCKNIKKVSKSKVSQKRIMCAILISFVFNFTCYKLINVSKSDIKIDNTPTKVDVDPAVIEPTTEPTTTTSTTTSSTTTTTTSITTTSTTKKKGTTTKKTTTKKGKTATTTIPAVKTSTNHNLVNKNGITYIDGYLIVNKTYSLPEGYIPTNTKKAITSETGICASCIDSDAYSAFEKMQTDAKSDGVKLWIQSGYRSYKYQNGLYNMYVKKDGQTKADTYSARPGHSEHQSGLAVDLNTVQDSFATSKEGKWVNANAYKYGFILRYPKGKESETGYKYEPWHIRYVGTKLAKTLYNDGNWITMESYFGITSVYNS